MSEEEFMACYDDASREVDDEQDDLKERCERLAARRRVLDAARDAYWKMEELKEEVERKQTEIDELEEQLEQRDKEIDDLRRQLLEVQNHQLESEKQQLEAEASAKPMEIHNHFGAGCSAQVFNDKVTSKFSKMKPWKRKNKKLEKRQEKRRA